MRTFTGHTGVVYALALSADGGTLFSGSDDQTVKQWDVTQGGVPGAESASCVRTFTGHTDAVNALALVDNTLFSGSWDRTVKHYICIHTTDIDMASHKALGPDLSRLVQTYL